MKNILTIIFLLSAFTMKAQSVVDSTTLKVAESFAVADGEKIIIDERSVVVTDTVGTKKQQRDWSTWRPSSKKATWLALIPGGGQIYNRKYWKLPIIYGGMMGCIYAWRWNNQMLTDYKQAYADLTDDDPNTKSYEDFISLGSTITDANKSQWVSIFKKRKDRYRRYRDLSIFCLIGVYAVSIIDAYVDASLSEFDISDDLSLKVTPAVMNSSGGNMLTSRSPIENSALGVNCRLRF